MKLPLFQLYALLLHGESLHGPNLFYRIEPFRMCESVMDNEWSAVATAKVHNNRRLRLPPMVREDVVTEDRFKGDVVHWNHDARAHVILLSERDLESDRYESPGSTQVHEHQNTVTPPKELVYVVAENFERYNADDLFGKGCTVVYLANSDMVDEEPSCYYLLSTARFFALVDENTDTEDAVGPLLRSATPS